MKAWLLLPLFLSACSITSTPKEERHKLEMSMHKMRTEMEDIKHDLNTSEIELHILEGKLLDQEESTSKVKEQITQALSDKIDTLNQKIEQLEKKFHQVDRKQEELKGETKKLSQHANETTTALAQYKEKILEFEKLFTSYNQRLSDLGQIKTRSSYVVKEGDSLEKIARTTKASVEQLKKWNRIDSDLIYPGQELELFTE